MQSHRFTGSAERVRIGSGTASAALGAVAGLLLAPLAHAQTDEIQVYDAQIVAPGRWNLTWHDNFTPAGRMQPDFPGGVVPDHALNGVPEWAYGVTDWFEAGAYVPIYTLTGNGRLLFDGVKLRTLFVSPHAAERPFFYGINFEYSYNRPQWDTARFSGEIRPILGAHLGRLELVVNPILDTNYRSLRSLDFAPAARVSWTASERWTFGLEQYADFGPLRYFNNVAQRQQTLFGVLDYNDGPNGLEFGIGHGFTAATDAAVVKLMLMHDF